jgi:hypothetical protein
MYKRVEADEPSRRTYIVPFEAANVGAPVPAVKFRPVRIPTGSEFFD